MLITVAEDRDENTETANPWAGTRTVSIVLIVLAAVSIVAALVH